MSQECKKRAAGFRRLFIDMLKRMDDVKSLRVRCPYCGESIPVEIDCSVSRQEYVEDCSVCCRPIEMDVTVNEQGQPRVAARREDD